MEPRVKTIKTKLNASNSSTGKMFYTPGKFNINGTLVNGNGYLNTLRCNCAITSFSEITLPPLDPAATAAEIDQRNRELRNGNRKTFQVYLKDVSGEEFELFQFDVFPTRPRYFADLAPFFSDLEIYGIGYGENLWIKAIDDGFGVLVNNDFVILQGSVLETCSFLLTDSQGTSNPTVIDLLSIPA